MEFKFPNTKKLYLTVEISQLLHKYQCTYNEADEILKLIQDEIQQQRINIEYNAIEDYVAGKKNQDAGDQIVKQLNHVPPYC